MYIQILYVLQQVENVSFFKNISSKYSLQIATAFIKFCRKTNLKFWSYVLQCCTLTKKIIAMLEVLTVHTWPTKYTAVHLVVHGPHIIQRCVIIFLTLLFTNAVAC